MPGRQVYLLNIQPFLLPVSVTEWVLLAMVLEAAEVVTVPVTQLHNSNKTRTLFSSERLSGVKISSCGAGREDFHRVGKHTITPVFCLPAEVINDISDLHLSHTEKTPHLLMACFGVALQMCPTTEAQTIHSLRKFRKCY